MKQQDGYFVHTDDYTDWHNHDKNKEWTEAEKALWILENGVPEYAWIFERVDNTVYKRPVMGDPNKPVPPWIDTKNREVVKELKSKTYIESLKEMVNIRRKDER